MADTRRDFLKTLGLGAAALSLRGSGPAGKGKSKPPNILFFISDDLTRTDIGCYGNRQVKTPNIDNLAS